MLLLFDGEPGPKNTLRFVEEKLGVGLWSLDIASGRMNWSRGMYHLLGYEPDSIEPSIELCKGMVHPNDRLAGCEHDRMIQDGVQMDTEFRVIRTDGRMRWLANRAEIIRDTLGRPQKAIGILFDVTPRQEARLAQRASEDRYRALAGSLSAIVWTTRADGRVVDIPEWREITGQSEDEVQGMGWLAAIHDADRDTISQTWHRAVAEVTAFDEEFRVRARDGSWRWVSCRATPLLNKDGSVREWIGVFIDSLNRSTTRRTGNDMVTGAQVRAARAILNWSVKDVADAAKVSVSTVRRLEEHDGPSTMRADSVAPIRRALETAGVEFLFLQSGKPGVRPRT